MDLMTFSISSSSVPPINAAIPDFNDSHTRMIIKKKNTNKYINVKQ